MRVVIIEDDPVFCDSLHLLLGGAPGIIVACAFSNAEDALASITECSPDILLVDLGLPGMSGIDFIGKAKEILPEVEIMVLTVFEDRDRILSAIRAGASSYMLKSSLPKELIKALYELNRGGAPMSPRIARKIIKEFQSDVMRRDQYLLSHREIEIIREIEAGSTYKEIAQKFSISTHTVHAHIRNIYKKLHADNKIAALIKARKKGIL
jgi:two-component system NarL family response regulator